MTVEVRNLQSGETFEVGPDGAVFGREGGPANIKVPDQSVSKRHARIFSDGSDWFLEDMGSVNGTLVDGGKIGGMLPLKCGVVFQMSKFKFEVVTIDGRGARPQAAPTEQETRTALRGNGNGNGSPGGGANLPSDLRKDPIPKKRQPAREPPPPPSENTNQRGGGLPLASDQDFPSQSSLPSSSNNSLPDVDAPRPQLGIDAYDDDVAPPAALAMGIGYALKTAPLLVLNPLGTVRKQIESPPLPGLQKLPLAFLVLPAYGATLVAQLLVGNVAATIASGKLDIVSLIIGPVIGAVVAVVCAVIAGFAGHPILSWLVDKLGGTSDARSRTTHVAMSTVTSLIFLVPTMVAVLLTAIAGRLASISSAFALINIVPALLMIVATPLPVFVQWSWFRSYNVAKWFQTVLLVFAVLGVLGGVAGAISTVVGAVQVMRAGGGAGVSAVPPPGDPVDPANPTDPVKDPVDPSNPTNPIAVKDPGTPTTPTRDPTGVKDPTTPAVKDPPTSTVLSGKYGDYVRKRAAIEAALERDPTLVQNGIIGPLYEQLSREIYNAEQEAAAEVLGPKRRSDPSKRAYLEKVKIATVFQKTSFTVNKLYDALQK
ncbi:MAG: FHA domain-containing protein [Deltaproteobacteria bacterium]|nr:FHA domain-containing protein [Deltaproteobacteria bacterium]